VELKMAVAKAAEKKAIKWVVEACRVNRAVQAAREAELMKM